MMQEATWDEAHEYASRVPIKYLECRVRRRHSWRPSNVVTDDSGYMDVSERCSDCRSTCFYVINGRGVVVQARKIVHSEGYLNTRGEGRITGEALGALRLEWIMRKLPNLVNDRS
jgi:hypothetical protein